MDFVLVIYLSDVLLYSSQFQVDRVVWSLAVVGASLHFQMIVQYIPEDSFSPGQDVPSTDYEPRWIEIMPRSTCESDEDSPTSLEDPLRDIVISLSRQKTDYQDAGSIVDTKEAA